MNNTISLIIPYLDEQENLVSLLEELPEWKKIPNQIIIVNTGDNKLCLQNKLLSLMKKMYITLEIITCPKAFPGKARNQGLDFCNVDIIAFLDTKTKPNNNWLAKGLYLMKKDKVNIVWGTTIFIADSFFEKAIRASTYGTKSQKTLPGSIIKFEAIKRIGYFIESIRAGEDADWIKRAQAQEILATNHISPLQYSGLKGVTIKSLIKKWYRNYLSSGNLSYIKQHRSLYFYFILLILVSLIFKWDWVSCYANIGELNLINNLFVANIIKNFIAIIGIGYFIGRIIILPIIKGVKIKFLLRPHNLLAVMIISIILDATKIFAFIHARFNFYIKKKLNS